MQLNLPEDSIPVKEMFERFFAEECTSAIVRRAEPVGFDRDLWQSLLGLEAQFMRLSAEAGGCGMTLFDTCLMMEEAGRRLAPVPLAESIVALRVLGEVGGPLAQEWIGKVKGGSSVLTMALQPVTDGNPQLVPGGAVADGILIFDGNELAIEVPEAPLEAPSTLGGSAVGLYTPGRGKRHMLSTNAAVGQIWSAAIEEWKLLMSAALLGLSREAVSMAAAYASERIAFGQPIGTYQGISHPLADDIIDADGGSLMLWQTLQAIADGQADAAAMVALLYWWASRTATNCVAHAIHTFGGYGLTNEYDIQLYHRRAKSWALAIGDPEDQLLLGGRRIFLNEPAALPDVGTVGIDFQSSQERNELAEELRSLFQSMLDPAKHRLGEMNFEAHDWDVHRAVGQAGLLFPEWPEKWGGRGADTVSARRANDVWQQVGYFGLARGVTGMAGALVQKFGSPELQDEVLLPFARGDVTSCLGFTEPSGGSDVFAAKTRAVRDGDEWVINGQKMFTSGAEWASYVLLLARTDPDAPKHKGLTVFLVPLNLPGVEIHPVHTFMDERTNASFYSDVRIPDRYRLGEVNSGVKAMSVALSKEQGGSQYHFQMMEMLEAVAAWARDQRRGGQSMLEHPSTLARLAKVHATCRISEALAARAYWTSSQSLQDQAYGPASKVFSTEAFINYSADLLDLAAPQSLIRGKEGLGVVEIGYRHSTATSVYGGTSEVLRSMVAERRLGMPRSRA